MTPGETSGKHRLYPTCENKVQTTRLEPMSPDILVAIARRKWMILAGI